MKPAAVHLRIGRVVVVAPAGVDRAGLARQLADQLPAAIVRQLGSGPAALPGAVEHGTPADSGGAGPAGTLARHVGAAVATHVKAALR
jgi:hypothetical protein